MNPLKVKWFRTSAKARVCYAWILVRLGLHRKAPLRYRAIFIKASDWLEATVEQLMSNHNKNNIMRNIKISYDDLQTEMASIHSKGKSLKESIENIKVKVLDLLEVCGIKDADIPLFNDPYMRNKRQSLITSFGIMFKSSSHMTPQRIRSNHARHNPTLYADMLIEELLAQAGSNDSDTSAQAIDSTPELPTSESSDSLDVQFASLFDIMESDLQTTSNSFSTSDGYPKASETSSNGSLPSREDELRERDAYYCDITIDRENNAELVKPSVNNKLYTLVTSDESQLLVRTVEGAESSPENFMFQTPPSRLIAPRSVSCKYRASPLKSSGLRRQHQFYSNNNIPSSSSQSSVEQTPRRSLHYYNHSSASGSKSLHYNHKSASSSRSCTTHPIASSTFIMDSDSPSTEAGSVYTWSIDEESSPCNLEKSYIRSTSGKKKRSQRQYELSSRASDFQLSRCIQGSQPNLSTHRDASHSIAPSDTDSTSEINSESSVLNDRPYITGKSSTSDSSSCTAARCRPRIIKNPHLILGDSVQSHPNQELLDSILTDSPRSVDSSGIFVPHNSYNSPVQSVGSHNGYSSSVSSCQSSDSHRVKKSSKAGPLTVSNTANTSTYIAPHPLRETIEEDVFKRPFNPAPHIDHTVRSGSRNQGMTTETPQKLSSVGVTTETPQRPSSVRSAPAARKSLFVVPPGVITGPPKIKDKKSLVKKLKQFSSHFYRKTEKIKTLANL